VLSVAFVLYVAITLWTTLHHEPFSDEADPWVLMRDGDAASIFRAASNRGVPLLFESAILPFARLGAPYVAQQLINVAYAWAAMLLVFRSRAFPSLVKILIAFSYYPAFEYSVVARPYSLQMLLTFAVAASWADRERRPLRLGAAIALLANTTTHGLFTAAVAGALWLWERVRARAFVRRDAIAAALMLAGGVACVAQLWPREGRQSVYSLVSIDTVWYSLTSMFFPDARVSDAVGPALIVLAFVTYGISRRALPVVFLWTLLIAMMLVFVYVWMGGLRHAGLLLIVTIAAVWIADSYGYRRERLLMAALAVSLVYSIWPAADAWVNETKFAFSGSREVAEFVRRERLDRFEVVTHAMFWTAPLAFLPRVKLWYPAAARHETFGRWEARDYIQSRVPFDQQIALAEKQMRGRQWILLTSVPLREPLRSRFRLIFQTREEIWRMHAERYWIYVPLAR
jgi:hypothetical protein